MGKQLRVGQEITGVVWGVYISLGRIDWAIQALAGITGMRLPLQSSLRIHGAMLDDAGKQQ